MVVYRLSRLLAIDLMALRGGTDSYARRIKFEQIRRVRREAATLRLRYVTTLGQLRTAEPFALDPGAPRARSC